MKIEVLNYTPKSIATFLEKIESHLPDDFYLSPLLLDLCFVKISIDSNNHMTAKVYDYLTADGNDADFQLEDADLFCDDVKWYKNKLTVNGDKFILTELSKDTPR